VVGIVNSGQCGGHDLTDLRHLTFSGGFKGGVVGH